MLNYETIISLLALGAFVGIVAGMFGIGGGGVLVPILTSIFLYNGIASDQVLHLALGTSMCSIIITSFSSFKAHNKKSSVHWQVFKMIAPGVVIGTLVGAFIASVISSFYLAIIFSIFMFYSSLNMFFSSTKTAQQERLLPAKFQFAAGGGIGIISSLVSIGGGILTVPFLTWQGIDIKKAIGTSSAVGFPLAISGTIGYIVYGWQDSSFANFTVGYVNFIAVFFVATASYFFAPLGVKLIHKIPSKNVKKIFALIPFALSIRMILQLI
ncbi:sulfite exporter TauE/SafE family protein [Campylobacter geochelonis]|uniref:Probable membrane transporter protein n=1 Tax=Campylobacter geochelonis TaxID=1780362 RepID=A0A128EJ46_9BACT|nr:sulfite exporter TauE/SafE family protein [Campylobacter geochelonis]QKF70785.1 sulfite exporter TauE/SafE family protein [Campylobacter geochelonis]CZE47338.1 Sulfite exporter TauE/SafE [Campylobacter geochelonis]CZE48657.1 Sulfite exporter TauE/SafE [Campylobacter geochelonis]CZE50554.1 Sulfite exporter TauE/SafE [Campylobacter geochelonis]